MVIEPLEGDYTPGTVKPFQVSLVEPGASQFQLWGLSCRGDFRTWPSTQLVFVKQTQPVVQPFATPPLPAEAFASPGTHQVLPDLLLYPAFDHVKTRTRMSDPKVVHPATQNRIDFRNHNLDGPADVLSEHLPELFKQRCPLLQL